MARPLSSMKLKQILRKVFQDLPRPCTLTDEKDSSALVKRQLADIEYLKSCHWTELSRNNLIFKSDGIAAMNILGLAYFAPRILEFDLNTNRRFFEAELTPYNGIFFDMKASGTSRRNLKDIISIWNNHQRQFFADWCAWQLRYRYCSGLANYVNSGNLESDFQQA